MRQQHVIAGVHGINTDGRGSTDMILAWLQHLEHTTTEFDWGPKPAIVSAISAKRVARSFLLHLRDFVTVDVVAHSWGARIVLEAMRLGFRFRHVFLFNPAISAKTTFPEGKYESITVIANAADATVTLGKVFLPFLGYGDMGRIGYRGKSKNVTTCFGHTPGSRRNHGFAFTASAIAKWANFIDQKIRNPTESCPT
jgi:pimeloyl-ACP methyl ester carboxylesterase